MKFIVIFAALVCFSCNFCQGQAQNQMTPVYTPKPSAHIESSQYGPKIDPTDTVIKGWSPSSLNSHLAGGMNYSDGKLTVPIEGRYYIYARIVSKNRARVDLFVNNRTVTFIQPSAAGGRHYSSFLYSGGVFILKAGDTIYLKPGPSPKGPANPKPVERPGPNKLTMRPPKAYFGAFYI